MRASVPPVLVGAQVTLLMKSSRGGDPYPVSVIPPGGARSVMCACRGYQGAGHCRHATPVQGWLEAVIPPRSLPE